MLCHSRPRQTASTVYSCSMSTLWTFPYMCYHRCVSPKQLFSSSFSTLSLRKQSHFATQECTHALTRSTSFDECSRHSSYVPGATMAASRTNQSPCPLVGTKTRNRTRGMVEGNKRILQKRKRRSRELKRWELHLKQVY